MVPGKGIDFGWGPDALKKTQRHPELVRAVQERVKSAYPWRDEGKDQGHGVRLLELSFQGGAYAVLFRAFREKCAIFGIFELPEDEGGLKIVLARVLEIFGTGQRKGVKP